MGRGLSIMGMKRLLALFLLACGPLYGANVSFDQTTKNTSPTNLNVKADTIAIGRTNSGSSGSLSLSGGINSPSPSLNPDKNHFIAGGQQHTITSTINDAAIVGGFQNQILAGNYSAIVGGDRNIIATNAVTAFIGGGQQNRVTYNSAAIAGLQNAVDGDDSAIITGNQCLITANSGWAVILGNDTSTITGPGGGDYYCILPGLNNNIPYALNSDDFCYILGGRGNRVTKANSWVMGMFLTNSAANQIEIGYNDFDKVRIDTNRLHLIGNMQIRMTNGANNGYVLTSTNSGDLVLMPTSSSAAQATPGVVNVASAATIIIDLALTNTPVVVLTNAPAHDISLIISNPAPARWFSFYADGNGLITNNAATWSGVSGLLLKWLDAATNSLIVSNGFISVSGYVAQTASKTNLVIAYRHE